LQDIKEAVLAVENYLKNPKQAKLKTPLKPITEEDEDSGNAEDDLLDSSFQDSSVQEIDRGIEINMEIKSAAENDSYDFDCIEESKRE
jgi:hypothetical protein